MECAACVSLIGLVVGVLIGLTGLGGGVLLLPLLIHGVQTPPLVAIGSGAAFSALTKVSGLWFIGARETSNGRWLEWPSWVTFAPAMERWAMIC